MFQLACPVCKVPLTEKSLGSAGYHVCESHGVWATIAFFSKFKNMRAVAADIYHSRMFLRKSGEEQLPCPQCFTPMKATEYKKVPGLILDQCFFCNGIWFDKGELNAIPNKAELEKDFNYGPLSSQLRTEQAARPGLTLNDGLPSEIELTPATFLGLPVEESRGGSGVSAAAVILALLCLVFSLKGFRSEEFYRAWAFNPQYPLRSHGFTLFTSLFLHLGWWHLLSNIYFLYITADDVEEVKGSYFVFALFFMGGLAGKFIYASSGATAGSVGASGGICAIMAYYAMSFPHNRIRVLRPFGRRRHFTRWRHRYFAVPAQLMLFYYLLSQSVNYFAGQAGVFRSRTNFLAHIAGLAVGLIAHVLTADHAKKD